MSRLGDFICETRTKRRLTLRALAEKAGVSAPFISDLEHGRRWPSAPALEAIADALDVPLGALQALDDRPKLTPMEARISALERRVTALERERTVVLR